MTDLVSKWILKAEQDFRIIKHETSLKEDEMVRDMVCFHCQQMAEKYLKAYLIERETEFPEPITLSTCLPGAHLPTLTFQVWTAAI